VTLPPEDRWLVDTLICHRGYHSGNGDCPENSLRAFEKALRQGLAVELDVRLLSDGELAVFHDSSTLRMTGVDRVVEFSEADEVTKMLLLESDQTIPLLDDVFDLIRGAVPLLIEIKSRGIAGPLEETLVDKLKAYDGPVAVQSFNPRSLLRLRDWAPHVARGQLSGSLDHVQLAWHKKVLVRHLLTDTFTRPHFVSYEAACIPALKRLQTLRERTPLLAWTVRSVEQYDKVRPYSDNIIFEGFDPRAALV
jgi:glycerophosphoryl diester phosphodiesterase